MARLFLKYLSAYINGNVPNSIKICTKYIQFFPQILNESFKCQRLFKSSYIDGKISFTIFSQVAV